MESVGVGGNSPDDGILCVGKARALQVMVRDQGEHGIPGLLPALTLAGGFLPRYQFPALEIGGESGQEARQEKASSPVLKLMMR